MNDIGINQWKPLIEKSVYLSIAAVTLFAMFNAAMYYFTQDSPVVASTNKNKNTSYQTDAAVFADIKPTPLITELNEVKQEDDDTIKVDFSAANVNATHKVKNFECSIDMKGWNECISPVKLNLKEYDNVNNHTLEIRVIDNHDGIEAQPLAHIFK